MKIKLRIDLLGICLCVLLGICIFGQARESQAQTVESVKEQIGLEKKIFSQGGASSVSSPKIFLDEASPRRKFIQSVFIVLLSYLVLLILIRAINNRVVDVKIRYTMRKNSIYAVNFFLIIAVFFIWIKNFSSLTIFLGFLSAGLALALQEVLICIAGWVLIVFRHPFEVGDRIEFGGVKGDVIDIRIFQTSLLEIGNWVDADQSTGRIVNIPNSFVYKMGNYNYSRGFEFIWNEIKILLTFESDWKKAKTIVQGIAERQGLEEEEDVKRKINIMSNRYMIYYGKLTPIVYVNIKDSGVELTLRYLTEAKKRRFTQDALNREILEAFDQESDVNFAYPTYRIVKND